MAQAYIHAAEPAVRSYNVGEVNTLVDELMEDNSWVIKDGNGNTIGHDLDALKDKAFELFRDHHSIPTAAVARKSVAAQTQVVAQKGVGRDTFVLEVFGQGLPGVGAEASEEERQAYALLRSKVWGYAGPGLTGAVQVRARQEGMLVVEASVNGGKVRFLTDSVDLIKRYLLEGRIMTDEEKLSKLTEKWLAEIMDRLPAELALPVARAAAAELKRIGDLVTHAKPDWVSQAYGTLGRELEELASTTAPPA